MVVETFHNPALPWPASAAPGASTSAATDNPINKFPLVMRTPNE